MDAYGVTTLTLLDFSFGLMISKYFMKEYDFNDKEVLQFTLEKMLEIFETH